MKQSFIANLSLCTLAMEACGGANFFAWKFEGFDHTIKLIAPQFDKPFVKGNKNDAADARAIVEAAQRPDMNFVSPIILNNKTYSLSTVYEDG